LRESLTDKLMRCHRARACKGYQ